jgi:VanZ family protein
MPVVKNPVGRRTNHYPMISTRYRWAVVGIYMLMLLFLSSIPSDPQQSSPIALAVPFLPFPLINDKVLHFLIYFPMGWLLSLTGVRWWKAMLIGAVLAALDESYQSLTPGRVPDGMDWLADMAGMSCGWLLEYRLKGQLRRPV